MPYVGQEIHLVEKAQFNPAVDDEWYRPTYQLKEPVREWLKTHRHRMEIDRGDWGEGAEHFYIRLYVKEHVDEFEKICESLR